MTKIAESIAQTLDSPKQLKTLGIGAATYGNLQLSTSYRLEDAALFLLPRIYHLEYTPSTGRVAAEDWRVKAHLVADGNAEDAGGYADDHSIFKPYWLDGFVREED